MPPVTGGREGPLLPLFPFPVLEAAVFPAGVWPDLSGLCHLQPVGLQWPRGWRLSLGGCGGGVSVPLSWK